MSDTFHISVHFFLQLTVILGACRVVGWLAARLGQSQVVSEMIAGVVLGPSLFGVVAPQLQAALFPTRSPTMTVIYCVAQVGLVLYMFLVGVEFRAEMLRQRARSAFAVSIAGMVAPFGLGMLLAVAFGASHHGLFTPGVTLPQAMLYMGAAMSITAFPMLARIIYERGISGTRLGTLALTAGSSDDAAAWCVLAIVIASFQSDPRIAVLAIGGGLVYVLFTLLVLRRWLAPLGRIAEGHGAIRPPLLVFVLMMLMLAAWFTDWIGIYAVFGAFILGVAMPRGFFATQLQRMLEPLTTNFLLPLFFVYSGLNTRIDLVNSPALWGIALLVLAAACLGKFGACWAAARLSGESPRDAAAVGVLMNARGLMELIILNIGLERGLITPMLFSIMVVMAIVTTLMATPLFEWIYRRGHRPQQEPSPSAAAAP